MCWACSYIFFLRQLKAFFFSFLCWSYHVMSFTVFSISFSLLELSMLLNWCFDISPCLFDTWWKERHQDGLRFMIKKFSIFICTSCFRPETQKHDSRKFYLKPYKKSFFNVIGKFSLFRVLCVLRLRIYFEKPICFESCCQAIFKFFLL